MTQSGASSSSKFDDLKTRSIVGAVFLVVGFLFIWSGGAVFSAFMAALCAVMLIEFTRLVKPEVELETIARMAMVILGTLSVFILPFSGVWFTIVASLGLLIAATVNPIPLGRVTVLGYALIVIGAGAAVHIRELSIGFPLVMWLILCVIAADIGGYAFGRLLQGPKLLPSISPKKTWSGFLGGLGLCVIVSIIFSFFSGGGFLNLVLFGALVSIVSVAGDLLESSVKRQFGVKDAGTLLPGHGGFLDRLDGMTLVMAVFGLLSFMVDLGAKLAPEYVAALGAGI